MPDSYSERRGFDSRRTDGNFGIVQLAGLETLNLAIQVRPLVPKPRRDRCAQQDTSVSRSLTIRTQRDGARPIERGRSPAWIGGGGKPKPSPFFRVAERQGAPLLPENMQVRVLPLEPSPSSLGVSAVSYAARRGSIPRGGSSPGRRRKRNGLPSKGPFVFW